jgi:hypothetical protein
MRTIGSPGFLFKTVPQYKDWQTPRLYRIAHAQRRFDRSRSEDQQKRSSDPDDWQAVSFRRRDRDGNLDCGSCRTVHLGWRSQAVFRQLADVVATWPESTPPREPAGAAALSLWLARLAVDNVSASERGSPTSERFRHRPLCSGCLTWARRSTLPTSVSPISTARPNEN